MISLVTFITFAMHQPVMAPEAEEYLEQYQAAQSEQIERIQNLLAERSDAFAREEQLHLAVVLVRAAQRNAVDPLLLLAMIQVESQYERRGRSRVGALGLMQLMPATARAFAASAGVDYSGAKTLMEPDSNIEIGAHYLSYLLCTFRGDRGLALAAYCHGPTRVRQLLALRGVLSPDERRYERRVLSALRGLLPAGSPSDPAASG